MQRDKRGRFVRKAEGGLKLPQQLLLRNGKYYKLKPNVQVDETLNSWLSMAILDPDKYEQLLGLYYEPAQSPAEAAKAARLAYEMSDPYKTLFALYSLVTPSNSIDYTSSNEAYLATLAINAEQQSYLESDPYKKQFEVTLPKSNEIDYTSSNEAYKAKKEIDAALLAYVESDPYKNEFAVELPKSNEIDYSLNLSESLNNTSSNFNLSGSYSFSPTPIGSNFGIGSTITTPSLLAPSFSLNTSTSAEGTTPENNSNETSTSNFSFNTSLNYNPAQNLGINVGNLFGQNKFIEYTVSEDGRYFDLNGKELNVAEVLNNPTYIRKFDLGLDEFEAKYGDKYGTKNGIPVEDYNNIVLEKSAGMNTEGGGTSKEKGKRDFGSKIGNALKSGIGSIDKTKLANFLEIARAGVGYAVNNKIAERALEAEKPFLLDVSESHRSVYGDYRSKVEGEKAAAKLRNMAANPMTSDGALLQQMMMDAQIKGQEYIDQGNAKDEAMIRQTREVALQQEKENLQQRQAAAMQNRQAMLMTLKNKAQILNARDSANFSQVLSPLMASTEQRLRNQGKEQEYYSDYYKDAMTSSEVWKTYTEGLSPEQEALRKAYIEGGADGVTKYVGTDEAKKQAWYSLKSIMSDEIIRRKAALKGVNLGSFSSPGSSTNQFTFWEQEPIFKSGGTIYKAKLTKRTKDNDRGAKSIESSKKLAARLLEKAIDSLHTYNEVEIVAKPKKSKRKYLAGGGLPFVNFTPVFATSEKGEPTTTKDKKDSKDDLTSKDVLELLKDMDGLPSDMGIIVNSLQNFELMDGMDPLGMSSSSDIASRYISLINKIKVAKFNREEYNSAFNQLKGNGGLNEFAVTSEGLLVGTNREGDFEYFTPDQVNAGEHKTQGYSLLTNSNLLYLRANSSEAAFNHQLTTFALNGIGMEVITKQISDIIQGLGSDKESQEGFVQMGSKGSIKKGIEFLKKAAQEVGDDSINENMSVADYYQAGYLTEDQATQALLALLYVWGALPTNAKSLLLVKGGSSKGAEALVKSLIFSKTSSETQFKATPKKMTKTGDGNSSSGDVDALKLSPVQMMQVGYTDHERVTLQKGTKYATVVNAQVLPITDVNKKLLGVTTLDKVAESTFGGALDMNNVTMGSQLIDPQALQNVQIDSTNLYVMNLPIDRNSPDGTVKPDLSWMSKIEEIDRVIRELGITDVAQINKLYTDAGLPVLMDDNGQLNIQDYCKFGVLNGHALNSAFKDIDLLDSTVLEIDDEDSIENVLSILNKGRSEKDRIDFDSKSWADSIFGTKHDSLFEGTIYIPIRTNAFTGMIGGGQYPDTETAAEVEALIQQKERTRGYVDPGLLM